jgi:hypothetical protein
MASSLSLSSWTRRQSLVQGDLSWRTLPTHIYKNPFSKEGYEMSFGWTPVEHCPAHYRTLFPRNLRATGCFVLLISSLKKQAKNHWPFSSFNKTDQSLCPVTPHALEARRSLSGCCESTHRMSASSDDRMKLELGIVIGPPTCHMCPLG